MPASTSCSSRSTTLAVVGAPASARISASSSRSQVSSSRRSKRLAEISSVSAWRLFESVSRRRRKTPRRLAPPPQPLGRRAGVASRAPRSRISCQRSPSARQAIRRRRRAQTELRAQLGVRGAGAGDVEQLLDRLVDVAADRVEVLDRLAVGEQAEVHLRRCS